MPTTNIIDHTLYPQSTISHIPEGKFALVRFTNGPPHEDPNNGDSASTVWLFDTENKTYQPFLNWDALKNAFPNVPEELLPAHINVVDTSALSHPDFQGSFLSHDYGIDSSGTPLKMYNTGGNSTGTALGTYGMQRASEQDEESIANMITATLAVDKEYGGISQSTFDTLTKDPTSIARYTTAYLYGGYSPEDILRDAKARELAAGGNPAYANFKVIDDNIPADKFHPTTEGQKSLMDQTLNPPSFLNLDPNFLKLPINLVPSEAFKSFITPIDTTDPKFKDEADKIQAGWFDIINAQLTAKTAQDKAVADQDYADFIKTTGQRYGIQLSNNAREAYAQLQGLFDQGSQRGIANSGVIDDLMQRKLRDIRSSNEYLRTVRDETLDANKRAQLLQNGTPAQIKQAVDQMDSEDKAKGVDPSQYRSKLWGLVPSDETKQYMSKENLKKVYPELSDAEIAKIQRLTVDSYGNHMSGLYQDLYSKQYNMQGTGTDQLKEEYQQSKLAAQKLDEEKKAMDPYTTGNQMSSYKGQGSKLPGANQSADTTPTTPAPTPTSPTAPAPYVKPNLNTSGTGFQSAPNADVLAGQAAEEAKRKAMNL